MDMYRWRLPTPVRQIVRTLFDGRPLSLRVIVRQETLIVRFLNDSRPDVRGCGIILSFFRVERLPVSPWRSNRVQELIRASSNFVCADIRFHP